MYQFFKKSHITFRYQLLLTKQRAWLNDQALYNSWTSSVNVVTCQLSASHPEQPSIVTVLREFSVDAQYGSELRVQKAKLFQGKSLQFLIFSRACCCLAPDSLFEVWGRFSQLSLRPWPTTFYSITQQWCRTHWKGWGGAFLANARSTDVDWRLA